jgi:NADH dehydrogenase
VVGSGATGIQFLFEIDDYLKRENKPWKLRLVDSGERPLGLFPAGMGHYVRARLEERGIEYIPSHYFLQQQEQQVVLEDRTTYARCTLPSDLTLYFSGKTTQSGLKTNWFGQVKIEGRTLPSIFSAGDCAQFGSPGSNSLTAQSAVRKGKLVAQNILKQGQILRFMSPYLHRDLGYVISMGNEDAIGWVGTPKNIIAGAPALSIKDIVESQYDLLLAGTDTFAL